MGSSYIWFVLEHVCNPTAHVYDKDRLYGVIWLPSDGLTYWYYRTVTVYLASQLTIQVYYGFKDFIV
jgi:hypothetical protein